MRTPSIRANRSGLAELSLVCGGLLIYYLIRGFVVEEFREARLHALAIIRLEQTLHIFHEPQLQRLLSHGMDEIQFWNGIYFWAHAPVIALVGVWLYLHHRRSYSLVRNAFLLSAVMGLVIYSLYPVAPPRLLAGYGFVDTMQRYSSLSYQAQSLKPFVNPYAAVPSLHFGWSCLIGVGFVRAINRPAAWVVGTLLPLLMLVAIIATANHFVFDAAVGFIVCGIALVAALAFERWQATRARETPAPRTERAGMREAVGV